MDLQLLQSFLGWNAIIHIGILFWWAAWLKLAHDLVFRMHQWWGFQHMSVESFDTIHYAAIAGYKLLVILFVVIPYFGLLIIQ